MPTDSYLVAIWQLNPDIVWKSRMEGLKLHLYVGKASRTFIILYNDIFLVAMIYSFLNCDNELVKIWNHFCKFVSVTKSFQNT